MFLKYHMYILTYIISHFKLHFKIYIYVNLSFSQLNKRENYDNCYENYENKVI